MAVLEINFLILNLEIFFSKLLMQRLTQVFICNVGLNKPSQVSKLFWLHGISSTIIMIIVFIFDFTEFYFLYFFYKGGLKIKDVKKDELVIIRECVAKSCHDSDLIFVQSQIGKKIVPSKIEPVLVVCKISRNFCCLQIF